MMLHGIDRIDWKNLKHAKGRASDLPGLFRDMLGADRNKQKRSWTKIVNRLWRPAIMGDGGVYEAAAFVVPYLYELAADKRCFERIRVINLLCCLSWDYGLDTEYPGKKERSENEKKWIRSAKKAVDKGIDNAVRILESEEEELRLPVANLLTFMSEERVVSAALTTAAQKEQNPELKAGLGIALGLIGDYRPELFTEDLKDLPMPMLSHIAKRAITINGNETAHDLIMFSRLSRETLEEKEEKCRERGKRTKTKRKMGWGEWGFWQFVDFLTKLF